MNDTVLKVAVCNHRDDWRYKNVELTWQQLKDRNRVPVRTTETVAEYPQLPKAQRDDLKDHGGFVSGWLRQGVRKRGHVISRNSGTLDADNIPPEVDFPALCREKLAGVEYFLYTTHKHKPEAPRYRLVFLFDREVSEDEYEPLMRMVAKQFGMDFFDDSTYEAHRMMYWASASSDGVFDFQESRGDPLSVDHYFAMYDDWRDVSQWPTSSRESAVREKAADPQQDPLNKDSVVGVFCREYFPIQLAMETFLPGVYAPTDTENRWDYVPSESTAGVVIYDDRFVYSHHATDPAGGKLLNAFDLVRIHKFGNDDTKKSFNQMCDFALAQDAVKLRLDRERAESASADFGGYRTTGTARNTGTVPSVPCSAGTEGLSPAFRSTVPPDDSWVKHLKYNSHTKTLENSSWNLMLILNNDPLLQSFAYNGIACRVQVTGELPWEREESNPFWRDADTAQLIVYLDRRYTVFSRRNVDACFAKVADDRRFHPVREYLENLPEWDGECRIDTLLCRCLQADDTPYVRAVTRKFLAAAVARIFYPGTKFDCVLVLDGAQGIGKSTIFRELAGDEYYSETLTLTDMNDKSAAEKLLGNWIVEIGELAGMRKAEIEKVKAFISTRDDKFRPSFGHVVESHPRQAVMVATVNGERGYLRDVTGNRRFWIVKCRQTEAVKRFAFSSEERDQIWAEAVWYWKQGEKLWLEGSLLADAEEVQRSAMEKDDRLGMVEVYLDTLLPESWPTMNLYQRRSWLLDTDDPTRPKGTMLRTEVSNVEIWSECFGRNPSDMKTGDSFAIAALMIQLKGWEKSSRRPRLPLYGMQRVYARTAVPVTPIEEPTKSESAEALYFLD